MEDNDWEDISSSHSNSYIFKNSSSANRDSDISNSELSADEHGDGNVLDTSDSNSILGIRRDHVARSNSLSVKMKRLQKMLDSQHTYAPWIENDTAISFWRKEHGWPRQIIFSASSADHYQCANALSVSSSEYGITDNVFTVLHHSIVKCGSWLPTAWWIEASGEDALEDGMSGCGRRSPKQPERFVHISRTFYVDNTSFSISPIRPYTKRLLQNLYPPIPKRLSYLEVEFHPICFTHKYGFLAVGSDSGQVLVYCTMNSSEKPMLILNSNLSSTGISYMINSLQIFRWRNNNMLSDEDQEERNHFPDYDYKLIISANDRGVIICSLNLHNQCGHRSHRSSLPASVSIEGFYNTLINDAKTSPNGKWIACVADASCVFVIDVLEADPSSVAYTDITTRRTFGSAIRHELPVSAVHRHYNYTSQYLSWNSTSTLFAHTSDNNPFVLVWSMPRAECIYSIPAGGNSYTIAFHPLWDSVLAFTNRYGFFHTVDLRSGVDTRDLQRLNKNRPIVDIVSWTAEEERGDVDPMASQAIHATTTSMHYARNQNVSARHEITMVSFKESNHIRILAKLNGMDWSRDGTKLYVATKKRVLYYEFLTSSRQIKPLVCICGEIARSFLEKHPGKCQSVNKDSENGMAWNADPLEEDEAWNSWWRDWKYVPDSLKRRIQGDAINLASHN